MVYDAAAMGISHAVVGDFTKKVLTTFGITPQGGIPSTRTVGNMVTESGILTRFACAVFISRQPRIGMAIGSDGTGYRGAELMAVQVITRHPITNKQVSFQLGVFEIPGKKASHLVDLIETELERLNAAAALLAGRGMVNIQEELIKLCRIFAWHSDHAAAAKSAPVALIKERVAASDQASAIMDPEALGQEDCEDATSELLAAATEDSSHIRGETDFLHTVDAVRAAAVSVGVDTVASLCAVGTPEAVGAASATCSAVIGCWNHKMDNTIKGGSVAMCNEGYDLVNATLASNDLEPIRRPVLLPNKTDREKLDAADELLEESDDIDLPRGAERLIALISLSFYCTDASKQSENANFHAYARTVEGVDDFARDLLLGLEEVGKCRFHERLQRAAAVFLGRGESSSRL